MTKEEKKTFIARLIAYITIGLLLPCGGIAGICVMDGVDFTSSSLGLWALLIIVVAGLFITSTLKWVYKGIKFSLFKQVIGGVLRIILPLTLVLFGAMAIKENIETLIKILSVVIGCEAVAIAINPLPEWYYKTKGEEMESVVDMAVDKFFTRKEQGDNK